MSDLKHECKHIESLKGHKYIEESLNYSDGQWLYHHKRLASPKVVYDGQAEYEGQIMFECKIYVNYCPDCGEALHKTREELVSPSSQQKGNETKQLNHQCLQLEMYNKRYPGFGSSRDDNGLWMITGNESDPIWELRRYIYAVQPNKFRFSYGFGIVYCPFCGKYLYDYRLWR